MLLLTALFAFLCVAMLTYALASAAGRGNRVRERLGILEDLRLMEEPSQPFAGPESEQQTPLFRALRGSATHLFPAGIAARFERKMQLAGKQGGFTVILVMWLVLLALLPGSFLFLVILLKQPLGFLQLSTIILMALLALLIPNTWLNGQIRRRQAMVQKSLPDAIDLLTTCVEAGLGLDAALARVAQKTKGPLAEDLSDVLNDVAMGRTRREALQDMARRLAVPDLTSFVNVIVQAEQLGVGVAQVLRVQAQQQRTRRRQRAEESAYKAPIKMIFPLVGFIFPSLFLVVLGPAGISLFETLTNQGR